MEKIKTQTVYVPVDVRYEVPSEKGAYFCIHYNGAENWLHWNGDTFYDVEFEVSVDNVNFWLKESHDKVVMSVDELRDLLKKVFNSGNKIGLAGYSDKSPQYQYELNSLIEQ